MRQAHRLRILPRPFHDRKIDGLGAHGALAGREVPSQRVSLELGMRQNATQIRMAFELDPEHVVRFAFGPVRSFPDIDHTVDRWHPPPVPAL